MNWKQIFYRIPIFNVFCFVLFPVTFYGELAREYIKYYNIPIERLHNYFNEDTIKKYSLLKVYEQYESRRPSPDISGEQEKRDY